jgi:hypothetical protein
MTLAVSPPGMGRLAAPRPSITAIAAHTAVGAAYGYGSLMYGDLWFDHAAGQVFEAKVQDPHERHARGGPSYRLTLAPWGR